MNSSPLPQRPQPGDASEAGDSHPSDRVEPDVTPALTPFRQSFRRHAAGVAIITALTPDGTPVGFTATSVASLSAVPPLATFNIARSASSWSAIADTDRVVIHMLGVRNRDVAQKLAGDNAQ